MENENMVKLHGLWASPYVRSVKIALKVKGIPYEYVEENLKKKSHLLLHYNPLFKKVPVLVHNGNPIVESLVILQYIDDAWEASPKLLPQDPYTRSKVRLWADFVYKQIFMPLNVIIISKGAEEERVIKEVEESMNILEGNMKFIFPGDPPSNDEDMGLLDILLSILPSVIRGEEEAFSLKLIDPAKYPLTCSRMTSLSELSVVKSTAPSHEKLVKFYRAYRKLYTC